MITINENINLDDKELKEDYIRSSGPGGQNVNKVSTAVQLRFNIDKSDSLSEAIKNNLKRIFANRISGDGDLIIRSAKYRSQLQNRQDALEKLSEMIRAAALKPKTRKKSRPSLEAKAKRLDAKKKRSEVKLLRKKVF